MLDLIKRFPESFTPKDIRKDKNEEYNIEKIKTRILYVVNYCLRIEKAFELKKLKKSIE